MNEANKNDIKKFIAAFKLVQARGFIKTNRAGNTGIGKTLEDYMQITENNIDAPDLHGFEIKSQRAFSSSYVTLFTRAPTFPSRANTYLRKKYGTPDRKAPDMKVLHTSMFYTYFNNHKSGYGFRLFSDDNQKKIFLQVKDSKNRDVAEDIYWTHEVLEKIITQKLNNLAFLMADHKNINGVEHFHFKKCHLFHGASFDKFLSLLKNDYIQFDIRIGVYRQGKNAGKTHDHGSGFRIKKTMLPKLFEDEFVIDEL